MFHIENDVQYYSVHPMGNEDGVPKFYKKLDYHWKHIPTGNTGIHQVYVFNAKCLQRLVAHWNSKLPEIWQYSVKEFENDNH